MSLFIILLAALTGLVLGLNCPWRNDEYQFFFPRLNFSIDGLVTKAPMIFSNPYLSSLVVVLLLIHATEILLRFGKAVQYWLPCYRTGRTSRDITGTLERALKGPVPGWQGLWMNLGRFLGRLTPPITWDFTPEQVFNPNKLTRRLMEGCLTHSDPNQQLLALYWGLACAYRAVVEYSQNTKAETETQAMPPEVPIAPVVKRKSWITTPTRQANLGEEEEARTSTSLDEGQSTERESQRTAREIRQQSETSRSFTPAELRDLRKDYSRQPGERILTWLLRCRDNGAESHLLERSEAQQLGSIARDHQIEREIGAERGVCSLWRRLLASVRMRYPFKEYLANSPKKWTNAEEAIQYLRELALLEIIYPSHEINTSNPEDISCTLPMWRKVIQGAPASFVNNMTTVSYSEIDEPSVGAMCTWLRNIEDNMGAAAAPPSQTNKRYSRDSSDFHYQCIPTKERLYECPQCENHYRDYRDGPKGRSQSWPRSRSPSVIRRRENPRSGTRGELWFYLLDQGENMRKWDGEPTSKLEARVKELRRKKMNRKAVHAIDADASERKSQFPRRRKTDTHLHEDGNTSDGERHGSESECSDQEQQ